MVHHRWWARHDPPPLVNTSWSTTVGEHVMIHHRWRTRHGPPPLVNTSWYTTVDEHIHHRWWTRHGPPPLVNTSWSTIVGEHVMVHHRWWTRHYPPSLVNTSWFTTDGSQWIVDINNCFYIKFLHGSLYRDASTGAPHISMYLQDSSSYTAACTEMHQLVLLTSRRICRTVHHFVVTFNWYLEYTLCESHILRLSCFLGIEPALTATEPSWLR